MDDQEIMERYAYQMSLKDNEIAALKARNVELEAENKALKERADKLLDYNENCCGHCQCDPVCETAHTANLKTKLAESEAECLEQARLNGMGSEREARLMARVAELEAENKNLNADGCCCDADEHVCSQAEKAKAKLAAQSAVVEAAKSWRVFHVCCPKDCPDLFDAQRKLGDALDALAAIDQQPGGGE